jgi:hypothetical protein
MRGVAWTRLRDLPGFLGIVPLDLEAPEPDLSLAADLVVCMRFHHHLPDAATRRAVLGTLRTLTRGHLVLSFHHRASVHNLRRALAGWVVGRARTRQTTTVARLRREAAAAGLELVRTYAVRPWLREFWIAVLEPTRS